MRQPHAKVDFIPQEETVNLATGEQYIGDTVYLVWKIEQKIVKLLTMFTAVSVITSWVQISGERPSLPSDT